MPLHCGGRNKSIGSTCRTSTELNCATCEGQWKIGDSLWLLLLFFVGGWPTFTWAARSSSVSCVTRRRNIRPTCELGEVIFIQFSPSEACRKRGQQSRFPTHTHSYTCTGPSSSDFVAARAACRQSWQQRVALPPSEVAARRSLSGQIWSLSDGAH